MTAGTARSWPRRTPVAVAVALGIVLAAVPVDASTHNWKPVLATGMTAEGKATTKPAAPSSVSVSCPSSSSKRVTVTWNAVTHASGYTVFRGSTTTAVASVTGTTWTSGTLSEGTYKFKVAAVFGTKWVGTKSSATKTVTISTSTPKCSVA